MAAWSASASVIASMSPTRLSIQAASSCGAASVPASFWPWTPGERNYLAPWGGTFAVTLTPSFGLDVPGARTVAQASPLLPLSVQGADATFAKLEATVGYSQSFAEHLAGSLSADAQTAFGHSLVRSEQTLEYGRQVARSDGVRDGNRFTLVSSIKF